MNAHRDDLGGIASVEWLVVLPHKGIKVVSSVWLTQEEAEAAAVLFVTRASYDWAEVHHRTIKPVSRFTANDGGG